LEIARDGGGGVGPDFDAGSVGSIVHGDVVDVDVRDDVVLADVLAKGSDGDAVRAVAEEVLDEHVGAVGLEGDAVIAVVDVRILYRDVRATVGIPTIRIFGRVVACASARDIDGIKYDIGRIGHEMVIFRAVSQVQIADCRVVETNDAHEDGSQNIFVLCVEIIPDLSVTVNGSSTININIVASELEESSGVLEDLLERVGLPVCRVVRELNITLNIDIDVIQIGKVQSSANDVLNALAEHDMSAVIAVIQSIYNVRRIVGAIIVALYVAHLCPWW